MTKRFTMYRSQIYDDGNPIPLFQCMKLLNKQHEEKGLLIKVIKDLIVRVNSMPCTDNVAMIPQISKIIKEYEND